MFKPRLTDAGMRNNPYWYSENPFYLSDNGLPNCTCYAWGRFWEESGKQNRPTLPLGNAEDWFKEAVSAGVYKTGAFPKLGAIICLADGPFSGYGHVAVVEEIKKDGTITFSNSAYGGAYFYISKGKASENYGYASGYRFQGFIYNPFIDDTPHPPRPIPTSNKKWMYYLRPLRLR